MLLYITAEDVFGSDTPQQRGPRPLHTIPSTLAGLYDLGLRHHVRAAAMVWWTERALERVPDWKLDRLAIRLALFGRERLGLVPGERLAVLGRLGWLWPALDFAAMGFGVLPVGIEHDLEDEAVTAIVAEAAPRAVFATEAASAQRLLQLRRAGRLGEASVVGESLAAGDGVLPLAELMDRAGVLDTAERAQSFRAFSRRVEPAGDALWHAAPHGLIRLTHAAAMAQLTPTLRSAARGDIAYLDAPRATLGKRLGLAAFVGDGCTTAALGRDGRGAEDIAELRPHKALVSERWLAEACGEPVPRWPAWLGKRRTRRRVLQALGGRLRWVEAHAELHDATSRALAAAGIVLDVRSQEPGQGELRDGQSPRD
jgi:hypothetical protein